MTPRINLDRHNVEAARIYDAAITILGLAPVFNTVARAAVTAQLRLDAERQSGAEKTFTLRMADLIDEAV